MFINSKTGCIAVGTVGKNAEYSKVGEKQTPTLKFSMVVGKDENDQAIWMNCQAWSKIAEMWRETIYKGDIVTVYGTIQTHEYNGKTYKTLTAETVLKTGFDFGENENERQTSNPKNNVSENKTPGFEISDSDGDLPF